MHMSPDRAPDSLGEHYLLWDRLGWLEVRLVPRSVVPQSCALCAGAAAQRRPIGARGADGALTPFAPKKQLQPGSEAIN